MTTKPPCWDLIMHKYCTKHGSLAHLTSSTTSFPMSSEHSNHNWAYTSTPWKDPSFLILLTDHTYHESLQLSISRFSITMRRSASSITLCFLFLLFVASVLANPISEASSPNPAIRFAKRSACSNGIKTNCSPASVACSGSQCTVCCGSCCQCFTCKLSVPSWSSNANERSSSWQLLRQLYTNREPRLQWQVWFWKCSRFFGRWLFGRR